VEIANNYSPRPLTKDTIIRSIFFLVCLSRRSLTFFFKDVTKIFDQAQFYRIFVSNFTFSSLGELVFGSIALFPLMRRFEREVRRYSDGF